MEGLSGESGIIEYAEQMNLALSASLCWTMVSHPMSTGGKPSTSRRDSRAIYHRGWHVAECFMGGTRVKVQMSEGRRLKTIVLQNLGCAG